MKYTEAGEYTIACIAKDACGNTTRGERVVTVEAVDESLLIDTVVGEGAAWVASNNGKEQSLVLDLANTVGDNEILKTTIEGLTIGGTEASMGTLQYNPTAQKLIFSPLSEYQSNTRFWEASSVYNYFSLNYEYKTDEGYTERRSMNLVVRFLGGAEGATQVEILLAESRDEPVPTPITISKFRVERVTE